MIFPQDNQIEQLPPRASRKEEFSKLQNEPKDKIRR